MADPSPTNEPRAISARWGFAKGFLTGLAIEIPALAATVWILARLGVGDRSVPFMHVIRLTAVFAGIAAVLTAGGIGRLCAHAAVDGGRRRAMVVGARAHAVASAGLVIIAVIPHGDLPITPLGWLPIPLAGLACGTLCGALIGAVCGGVTPVGLAEVWSLAKRPGDALKHLLDPEDLGRLGSSLRERTTHFFEGMFDPAPKPPALDAAPPAVGLPDSDPTPPPPAEPDAKTKRA